MDVIVMQLDDSPLTVFSAAIDDRDGAPVIQIPDRELDLGTLSVGDTYRIALIETQDSAGRTAEKAPSQNRQHTPPSESGPPVTEGDQLDVEIEDVGEQGDGVARVGPGYIVFVPETHLGDRVTIEITKTLENFGFAEVVTPETLSG